MTALHFGDAYRQVSSVMGGREDGNLYQFRFTLNGTYNMDHIVKSIIEKQLKQIIAMWLSIRSVSSIAFSVERS